jgi:hypothetical protein
MVTRKSLLAGTEGGGAMNDEHETPKRMTFVSERTPSAVNVFVFDMDCDCGKHGS